MTLHRLDVRGFSGSRRSLAGLLPRPVDEQVRSSETVAAIVDEVRRDGDAALRRLTEQFDGVALDELRVPAREVQAALDRIPSDLADALGVAHDRILAYHAHESSTEVSDFDDGGVT
ncbi:MAG: histidinol dehydrogenase, partial [Acidimicrobiales bacterium]